MLTRSCRAVVRVVFLLFTVSLMTISAMGQGTSSIRGTVRDQQGSVVPNANVTITNSAINLTRTMKSGPTGNFNFDFVPPGHYQVVIEAQGFKKATMQTDALISTPSDLNISLVVGASSETIEVTSESAAVQVNTQDSALGSTFVSEQITQLPMEARDVRTLLTLQAGVTKDGYVAGARSDQSNITLDGVNINDAQTNSISGPVLRLNSEAVEEFRVNTMTSSAAAGRSSGAQIALVSKSGSNKFHGSLFEFNRDTYFTANDWFSNHATPQVARRDLVRNTFGGSFGGPIKKDKLFFFYSYEGRKDTSSYPVSARIVPLPSLAQGDVRFPTCTPSGEDCIPTGNTYTLTASELATIFPDTGGVNPDALTALVKGASYGSNSNEVGDSLNTAGLIFNAPAPARLNSHVGRLDWNITQNQTLFARANVIHDHDSSDPNNLQWLPDNIVPTNWSHPWGLAIGHTWTINNNLVSNFHYGLTRQAYTQTGDTPGNYNYLRLVFYPSNGTRDSSRTTPVHSFVEDLSLVKGNHTFSFGGTFTLVANGSINYNTAYDRAYANPSGYLTNSIINSVNQYMIETTGTNVLPANQSGVENAITALIGRYNNYTANFNFDHSGNILAAGTPRVRDFKTQGYEGYFQDTWKIKSNLTLTAGLRYSLWRPAYEANGFEAQPNIPLGEFFKRRVDGMNSGNPYNDLLTVDRSGPVNGGKPMYNWDKTVFLPKVAIAWSPRPQSGMFAKLLGKDGASVFRGGFAIMNDYFGQQIATFFDDVNTLGFSSATVIPVNTYDIGCGHYVEVGNGYSSCTPNVGPLFTGFGQDVKSLPGISSPGNLVFPQQYPAVHYPTAIEASLDSDLQTPKNYAWSATYERELGKGSLLQISYLGRLGRHLLAQRDVVTPTNLRDPVSGMDWYTAATTLEKARQQGVDPSYFAANPMPYFENLFSPLISDWGYTTATEAVYDDAYTYFANDWTSIMLDIDSHTTVGQPVNGYHHAFYQPQYGALTSWATIGNSTYNALAVSFRERMRDLTVDFNYTYSHSLDDASGLQNAADYSGSALILNPFRQRDNYTSSDFDMRHIINISSVWELPFGKGKTFLNTSHPAVNAILGGWQFSNIFRWNTGIPFGAPYDANTWSTNWEVQSYTTHTTPVPRQGCPSRPMTSGEAPKFFGNCLDSAFGSFRPSYPGETGERNYFRFPNYINLDFGLGKTWKITESQGLQFRWEVFNATNTQRFGENLDWSRSGWGIIPDATSPTTNFSNFVQIQGTPRVMQFGLRYAF
ncbi:MAG TPA: TonB-dependent receptor [Terriglobales bacterium]